MSKFIELIYSAQTLPAVLLIVFGYGLIKVFDTTISFSLNYVKSLFSSTQDDHVLIASIHKDVIKIVNDVEIIRKTFVTKEDLELSMRHSRELYEEKLKLISMRIDVLEKRSNNR